MARRLKTIAKWVNENLGHLGYSATADSGVEEISTYLGHNIFTSRTAHQTIFTVKLDGRRIFSHDSAEAYRKNADVERWLKFKISELVREGKLTLKEAN